MIRPFAKLVLRALVEIENPPPKDTTMGQVSDAWGEPIERVYDAFDAARLILYYGGQARPPYVPFQPSTDPWINASVQFTDCADDLVACCDEPELAKIHSSFKGVFEHPQGHKYRPGHRAEPAPGNNDHEHDGA
jgi:hypothetical protein